MPTLLQSRLALLILIIIMAANETSGITIRGGAPKQPEVERQARLLGNLNFGTSSHSSTDTKLVRNKITKLLDKISDFEKIRAKASSLNRLSKIVKSFQNICPPNTNSLKVGGKCYEHVTRLWMDYDSAIIYCTNRGGALASPHLENDHYLKELREYFPSLGDNSVLVGISDILHEGHFQMTDGTPIPPYRFYDGKPPIYADKDCVSLTTYRGFGLIDVDCKRLHEVLCQYDPVDLISFDHHHHYKPH